MIAQPPQRPLEPKPSTPAPVVEIPKPAVLGHWFPKPIKTFAEAGLDTAVVESLILKYLVGVGSATGGQIATELCLPGEPIIEYLALLKHQQIVVHVAAAAMGDFTYRLTEVGMDRAQRYLRESMYVGPAPVPVDQYIYGMLGQTITKCHPKQEDLNRAFSDLLVSHEMFEILGPAINSGRGMFLYGYPGNGKTSIAERITRCFGDSIYIPKCLICDGFIIKLFDTANHSIAEQRKDSIFKQGKLDNRWVKITRPTIIVGGELTMETLEIQYNETSKVCEAPVQLKSNCGTLVIDDFGRQRIEPAQLLNRWIVPLEKRYDFLTMPNGKKLQVPFDQLIIFSTNLEPKDLCDDAFLRRIPYKINVPDPTETQYRKLFEFVAPGLGFTIDDQARKSIDYVIETYYKKTGRPFRCCQPRDLMLQVKNRCLYTGREPLLTPEMFDYAASVYFTVM
ncbi:MAG: AAA family ATPase [Planctomycetes bacterium]|nr:AAA family ATPase [Planctomycetota bacterium]